MSTPVISLAGAAVVVPGCADATLRFAGLELARFLQRLSGRASAVRAELPPRGPAVVLDPALASQLGVAAEAAAVGDQGYRIAAVPGRRALVAISAATSVGVLYGVYGLLEELGMGFYAGGETYPDLPAPAAVDAGLDRCEQPVFRMRGNMLHYNFLCGCTTWGLHDYQFYFDQLARMRANVLLMHWYDGEPGAAYEYRGEYLTGGVTPNSLTKPWGAMASLRTSQFSFETGRFFDEEIFSAPMGEDQPDLLTEVKRSEAVFAAATRYARVAGIHIAAGFETPRADPTDPEVEARFRERLTQFLRRNPDITHFALWQHESGGCVGSEPPAPGTAAAKLLEQQRAEFAYLGNDQRVWEAIRYGRFAEFAHAVLAQEAPGKRLVLVGWGGDRWMQFADFCLAYHKRLPPDVIFTCHDNIDASFGPNVSTPWGQLPPERERWAMPWVEGDIEACDVRQPHVASLEKLAPDALRKGCQGLLTLQWRTRDVEEETGYIARFAWKPTLTLDEFCQTLARHSFGSAAAAVLGPHLATLQRLGARWTGVRGTVECGRMTWAGWVPHFPFELEATTADYLLPKLTEAIDALAVVPRSADAEAAFHLVANSQAQADSRRDLSRPGVAELQEARTRLEALRGVGDDARLRTELRAIEEHVYGVRPRLVAFGMAGTAYRAIDGFLIAVHHLQRNAGVNRHLAVLAGIRRDLDRTRAELAASSQNHRLERLDYLLATLDFALHFDPAVMLLADGGTVDQTLAVAEAATKAGRDGEAARLAAQTYADLVAGGVRSAILAFTRKLTTRCDWGTLCTLNVKPLPMYWDTIGRLEGFLPAAPPRYLQARGRQDEVWLSWEPGPRCAAQQVYCRAVPGAEWQCVNAAPLAGSCRMFVDRPGPGTYEYAITAVSGDGWESPRSHLTRVCCGDHAAGPRLVACRPPARLAPGATLEVRVIALSDRDVQSVELLSRPAGAGDWRRAPMLRRFRDSYAAVLVAADLGAPLVEFMVEAVDGDGVRSSWPETGAALPWSLVVT